MHVRPAVPDDGARFLELVDELATFERMEGPSPEAARRLLDDAFGASRRFDLFVAEDEGRVVSYAAVFETYSTFLARPILHLEDLYVTPAARRKGVARAMMRRLAQEAVTRGCARLSWVVLDWNVDAQRFYQGLGAAPMREWLPTTLHGEALTLLAQEENGKKG